MKRPSFTRPNFDESYFYGFLLFLTNLSLFNAYDHCIVTAPAGTFRGLVRESVLSPNNKFCTFLGIRYGRLMKNERFQRPVLAEPLAGAYYDATSDGNQCPQLDQADGNASGDENCLHLNVFTPKVSAGMAQSVYLPVIVYIHGGAFTYGSSSSKTFSPDFLIQHGIVFVSMNYRLNVFGFLDLGIPECGGNMGLRDQLVALRWVRENIRSFGGDPNSVTVMGLSAGAISIYLLQLSPAARGLFHRAIIQSAITRPGYLSDGDEIRSLSVRFTQFVGYRGDASNRREMLRYLKQLDARQLLDGFRTFSQQLRTQVRYYATLSFFHPSADAHLGNLALFPDSVEALGRESPGIPIIIGQSNLDGSYYFYQHNVEEFVAYVQNYLSIFLDPVFTKDERLEKEVVARVKRFYFNPANHENLLTQTILFLTDIFFYRFYEQNAAFKASYFSNKIYNYQFCYDGSFQTRKRSYLAEYASAVRGVAHAEDIHYLLYSQNDFLNHTLTNDDRRIIYEMSTWWTNFAKTGNPNSDCDHINGDEWKPITPKVNDYLRIDSLSYLIKSRINEERRQFWDSLPHA